MKTSERGIKAIAKREGTILHVYKDSKGLPTAGVGHLITDSEHADYPLGRKITQAQSDAWLAADLKECEDAVNSLGVNLKQNEFDALVSLAFNIGIGGFKKSTVARKLKAGDKAAAAEAILLWNKPPEIQGRRRTEYVQFKTPYQVSATRPAESTTSGVSTATDSKVNSANPTTTDVPPNDPPPSTTVAQTTTEATKTGDTTSAVATTITQEQPKGDPPEAPPIKVSKNQWFSHVVSAIGGSGAVVTAIWGWMGNNLNAVGIGLICLTLIILALMFRKAILDAIRMQTAADPDKRNVT